MLAGCRSSPCAAAAAAAPSPPPPSTRWPDRPHEHRCRTGRVASPWLTVVGIGDDGLAGLTPSVRTLIETAELLVGGARHQAMIPDFAAERLTWDDGIPRAVEAIARWRGRRVVVLASGEPLWFGGGGSLARHFGAAEMAVIPFPGAFSLATARMLWPLADVACLTVHSRPLASLNLHLHPGARLLVLSRDGETPAQAAALLTARGFGPSVVTVLEHLGGPAERRYDGIAESWSYPHAADLNTLAIECRAGPRPLVLPRTAGLPDALFENDGQLTKREVRAVTIAALAPLPGQVLWDVGAGCGSVAIEWLRAAMPGLRIIGREAQAIAIERDPGRCAAIARNAAALGVRSCRWCSGKRRQRSPRSNLTPIRYSSAAARHGQACSIAAGTVCPRAAGWSPTP
ncbi:MAG: precorrin-6y C5,15-methyltransferase (decarboxylating) subunit CbiE [Rhodospirillales bacterium]